MNKTRTIIAVLLVVTAAAVFANGTQEQNVPRGATGDALTLTGKIRLQANDFPILTTSSGSWELMYPRYYADQVQVKDGDTVTVTGYAVPGPRWDTDGEEKYLAVTKATIGGKDYVVQHQQVGMGGRGGRGGMMQNNGRMMQNNGPAGRGAQGGRW